MAFKKPTLYLLCGKIAAGKSTLAVSLAAAPGTVLLREDRFMIHLYPGEIQSITDYARCSARLRDALGPHVVDLLRAGMSVVLDFAANTHKTRAWMSALIEESGAHHELHDLRVPDEVCRERLRARNAAATHEYVVSDTEFDLFTSRFEPVSPNEGFNVIVHWTKINRRSALRPQDRGAGS